MKLVHFKTVSPNEKGLQELLPEGLCVSIGETSPKMARNPHGSLAFTYLMVVSFPDLCPGFAFDTASSLD